MSDTRDNLLRECGFGFCCAITASLSHEINNVLATINELSGLLDDSIRAANQGASLDREKAAATTQRIAAQVERGRQYVEQLNQFAHTVDDRQGPTALNDAVRVTADLCRRFGVLRDVEFRTNICESPVNIDAGLFDLQHLIFRCIDIMLCASGRGDEIRIDVEPQGDDARMTFVNQTTIEATAELPLKQDLLALLVTELRGSIESTIATGEPARLVVDLPRSANR